MKYKLNVLMLIGTDDSEIYTQPMRIEVTTFDSNEYKTMSEIITKLHRTYFVTPTQYEVYKEKLGEDETYIVNDPSTVETVIKFIIDTLNSLNIQFDINIFLD